MKTCKVCKLEMMDDADKCPHCHSYNKWIKNPHNQTTVVVGIFTLIFFVMVLYVEHFKASMENPSPKAEPNVSLTNLHTVPFTNKCFEGWQVVGYLKNDGPNTELDFRIKFELLDSTGTLIDVDYDRIYEDVSVGDSTPVSFVSNGNAYVHSWKYKIINKD